MRNLNRLLAVLLAFSLVCSGLFSALATESENGNPSSVESGEGSSPVETEHSATPTVKPEATITPEPSETPAPANTDGDSKEEPAVATAPPPTSATFVEGLARLGSGTKIYSDRLMTTLFCTTQADGIAYAFAEEEDKPVKAVFTLDGNALSEGYVASDAFSPLTKSEIQTYLEQYSKLYYEDFPLFSLSVSLANEHVGDDSGLADPSFVEGLVTVPSGTAIYAEDALAQLVGTMLSDGVVYLMPVAANKPLSIAYTVDGKNTANGYVAADAVFTPLEGEELDAYLSAEGGVLYNDLPLFALDLQLSLTYEQEKYGFPGMPLGYTLSAEELADKAALITNGTLQQMEDMVSGKDYVEDEVLLLTDSREYAEMVAASYYATVKALDNGLAVLKLNGFTVVQVITAAADPQARLIAVNPNYYYHFEPDQTDAGASPVKSAYSLFAVPAITTWANYKDGDPFLKTPSGSSYQYMHDVVGTYGAWGLTEGTSNVKIGVIDSGVLGTHTELSGKVTQLNSSITGDAVGHGTHVAGIIAAKRGNGSGGAGIAPGVSILAYGLMASATASISTTDICEGLAAMRSNENGGPAWAINMSLGGPAYSSIFADAVQKCINAGIPIIAATGNDGGTTNAYPANYPGVISVAATDGNNMRAPYSNYGQATLSAPGSYIVSTYKTGGYASMSGTSMATPVVTGVVALYYSAVGTRDLNGDDKTDANDVAYLKKVLTGSCTTPAGSSSGMGAGIVNATNMFKKVVTKPTITLKNGGEALSPTAAVPSTATVEIQAGYNGKFIIYTTDGTTPSIKNGEVANGKESTTGTLSVSLVGLPVGKCTIKAMSVNAQGVASGVSTLSFTIDNKTPSSVIISGPQYVCTGKTGAYTAAINPVTKSLKVTWSIVSGGDLASIAASTGKLTIKKGLTAGIVTIRATVVGYTSVSATYSVNITAFPAKLVQLNQTSLTLNIVDTSSAIVPTATLTDGSKVEGRVAMSYSVTSSNVKIVTVEEDGTGWVATGVAPGKATLTFTALDGSAKKATCAVTVKRPVTSLSIEGGTDSCIAIGKSKTLKPVITPADATNKNVIWTITGTTPGGITLSPKGVLTASRAAESGATFTVTCTSADNPGASSSQTITITPVVTAVTITSTDPKAVSNAKGILTNATLYTLALTGTAYDDSSTSDNHDETAVQLSYNVAGTTPANGLVMWSTSNAGIATVDQTGLVTAVKAGTATITCAATDGSGKKASITIKVIVPNSYINISPNTVSLATTNPILGYGKTSKILVNYGNTYGTPTVKAVKWDFVVKLPNGTDITPACKSNGIVKITSAGALTVKNYSTYPCYTVTVTATTTDGTNLSASITYNVQPLTMLFGAMNGVVLYNVSSDQLYRFSSSEILSANVNDNTSFFFYTDNDFGDDYTITSSNPSVAAPYDHYGTQTLYVFTGGAAYPKASVSMYGSFFYINDYGPECWMMEINVMAYKPGTAKITVKTNDGSNKSCTFSVTVR